MFCLHLVYLNHFDSKRLIFLLLFFLLTYHLGIDLRAGAALIVAGVSANGVTEVYNLGHIDRGYENIEEKFRKIGANIKRVNE